MKKGFTIVELMIYMALLTIFLLVLLDIFVATLNFKLQSEATSALNEDARFILASLNYNIYNSHTANVPVSTTLSLDSGTKVYTLSGTDLLLNSVKLNSLDSKVDSITFTKIAQTIQISFTIESQNQQQTINTTLGLR